MAVDSSSNIYTTGTFTGTVDFDPGSGTFNLTSGTDQSIFVSKLSSSGQFVWAKGMTITSGTAVGTGIAIDQAGQVYSTGWFQSSVDFDPGPGMASLTRAGFRRCVCCRTRQQRQLRGAQRGGGIDFDVSTGIAVSASGTVAIVGSYTGPATFGATTLNNMGGKNGFVAEQVMPQLPLPLPPPPLLNSRPAATAELSNADGITNVYEPGIRCAGGGRGQHRSAPAQWRSRRLAYRPRRNRRSGPGSRRCLTRIRQGSKTRMARQASIKPVDLGHHQRHATGDTGAHPPCSRRATAECWAMGSRTSASRSLVGSFGGRALLQTH